MALKLDRDDFEDIGFVKTCFIADIINICELKDWIYLVIEKQDEVPFYLFKMLELKSKRDFKPLDIIGYVPFWMHTDAEYDALLGVGYLRSGDFWSDKVSRHKALERLNNNMHIRARFYEMFPFLKEKDGVTDI